VTELDGQPLTLERALEAVQAGRYQVCLVVEAGTTEAARERAAAYARWLVPPPLPPALGPERRGPPPAAPPPPPTDDEVRVLPHGAIALYFDPANRAVYRKALLNALQRLNLAVEEGMVLEAVRATAANGAPAGGELPDLPWEPGELVTIAEPEVKTRVPTPTSVQQNVPGWALFGMFLVVVPLSSTIIQERERGTWARLGTLPVSRWTLLGGRMAVYLLVCLLQLALMVGLGRTLLPWLGTSTLELGGSLSALALAAVASALAAIGLGLLLGATARTTGQATVLGATFTVIAAALGGIMVPVFLMPAAMQRLSVLSPLNWGHEAMLAVLLRDATPGAIAAPVLRLLLFALGAFGLAVIALRRRG
jgi:ABC-2 type transport system permease protein